MKIFPAFLIKAHIHSVIRLLDRAQAGGILGGVTRVGIIAVVKADSALHGRRWSSPDEAINVCRTTLYVLRDLVPPGRMGAKEFKRLGKQTLFCCSTAWKVHMIQREFSRLDDAMASMRTRHAMPDAFRRDWPTLH